MDNYIYEMDYAEAYEEYRQKLGGEVPENFLETVKTSGVMKAFDEEWKKIPRTVNNENAKIFWMHVCIIEDYVKNRGGKIRAEVNFKEWFASITIHLPFVELSKEDLLSLTSILKGTDEVNIYTVETNVKIEFDYFNYFDLPDDAKTPDEVLKNEIDKIPGLADKVDEWTEDYYDRLFSFFMCNPVAAEKIQEKADEAGMPVEEYFRLLAEDVIKEEK